MDTMDLIYLWKRKYWEAIDRGLDPAGAARSASRTLPRQPKSGARPAQSVKISSTYPAVPA